MRKLLITIGISSLLVIIVLVFSIRFYKNENLGGMNDLGDVISLTKLENEHFKKNKKFKHIKKIKSGKYTYSVTEYVTPKNEKGYQIIITKTEGNKKYIKSIGYGVEKASRTYGWREYEN